MEGQFHLREDEGGVTSSDQVRFRKEEAPLHHVLGSVQQSWATLPGGGGGEKGSVGEADPALCLLLLILFLGAKPAGTQVVSPGGHICFAWSSCPLSLGVEDGVGPGNGPLWTQ